MKKDEKQEEEEEEEEEDGEEGDEGDEEIASSFDGQIDLPEEGGHILMEGMGSVEGVEGVGMGTSVSARGPPSASSSSFLRRDDSARIVVAEGSEIEVQCHGPTTLEYNLVASDSKEGK